MIVKKEILLKQTKHALLFKSGFMSTCCETSKERINFSFLKAGACLFLIPRDRASQHALLLKHEGRLSEATEFQPEPNTLCPFVRTMGLLPLCSRAVPACEQCQRLVSTGGSADLEAASAAVKPEISFSRIVKRSVSRYGGATSSPPARTHTRAAAAFAGAGDRPSKRR